MQWPTLYRYAGKQGYPKEFFPPVERSVGFPCALEFEHCTHCTVWLDGGANTQAPWLRPPVTATAHGWDLIGHDCVMYVLQLRLIAIQSMA